MVAPIGYQTDASLTGCQFCNHAGKPPWNPQARLRACLDGGTDWLPDRRVRDWLPILQPRGQAAKSTTSRWVHEARILRNRALLSLVICPSPLSGGDTPRRLELVILTWTVLSRVRTE